MTAMLPYQNSIELSYLHFSRKRYPRHPFKTLNTKNPNGIMIQIGGKGSESNG